MNISMNRKLGRAVAYISGTAILAISLSACGLFNPTDPSGGNAADETATKLSSQLSLPMSTTDSLRDALSHHGGGNPAPLWQMAADLQKTLTPEQKQILFNGEKENTKGEIEKHDSLDNDNGEIEHHDGLDDDNDSDGGGCHAGYPMDGFRHLPTAEMLAADSAAMANVLGLTVEQQAALYNLRVEQRAAMDSLETKFKAGEIDRATFATELAALRATRDAALSTILDATQLEIVKIHQALVAEFHGHDHHGRGHGHHGGDRDGDD